MEYILKLMSISMTDSLFILAIISFQICIGNQQSNGLKFRKEPIPMSITKEQFEKFNKHFKIIEETNASLTHIADFNFEDIEEYKDEPESDDFFMYTNWNLEDSEVMSSNGYFIYQKGKFKNIKEIYDFKDILNFIESEMEQYL